MRCHILSIVSTLLLLCSCSKNNHIPDISIFAEIPPEELAVALKAEEDMNPPRGKFEDIYPGIRKQVESMSAIDKAKVAHLTYRELINALDVMTDSVAANEIHREWQATYDKYLAQAKELAKQMTTMLIVEIRPAIIRSYMQGGNPNFAHHVRQSSYYKYLSRMPINSMDIDSCWDYVTIIKEKIDPNFNTEQEYCSAKQLDRIKDTYPEAHYFLAIHEAQVNESLRRFENY